MKKIRIIIILLGTLFCFGYALIQFCSKPNGSTIESREELLENTPKGTDWNIAVEQKLEDYIVSGIYSSNGKSGLAIFEPKGNGTYKLVSREWRSFGEIIITGFIIDGTWYDLVWFNGAETNEAELTYTKTGEKPFTINFETDDMQIICNPAPSKNYTLDVVYYDEQHNRYE